jgi:DNA-binding NarL/FixJ family response regulator
MPILRQTGTALARSAPGPSAEPLIQVVLADEHALMRRRLAVLLDADEGVEVIAEAGDLQAARQQVNVRLPHVLVIDLSMSNGSSIEAIRQLRRRVPDTQIVVLTMEESTVFVQEALDAGAIGFVIKHAADAELAEGVRCAARGERYVSPRVRRAPDLTRPPQTEGPMENHRNVRNGGDFAAGEETLPKDEHVGSFAAGEETLPQDEHAGSFAAGEETLPEDDRIGTFADHEGEDAG